MAKDTKFGMLGGVFTPSVLTILGVIMYLRLPWIVGQAGLWPTLGIILIAHVVSIATGLSISSIATDKKVGAGGPYYIVSRSLGLPIGGTLGLALFVGLSFSISLYVIGFSESFLGIMDIEATPTTIRICGTATLVLLMTVTFISTSFAIKTQYVILVAIAVSLVSIFLGSPEVTPTSLHTEGLEGAPDLAFIFAIFFPAVTGFTAGVNMSGDLKDPKAAIPVGTMLSIGVGLVVYVGLAWFLAATVTPEVLVEDYDALLKIALFPPAVIAGIWGATLSSALGSILGAPRILQATAVDGITPKIFAKGHGKANEPRNALVLACVIGEAGILIAELDAIARIVSMVFLTTYGFLNLTSAIESIVSPDFRPSFRIPRSISFIGAATCTLLMIQLDMLAMAGATAVMAALFVYLQRRQLRLESGDAWEGIWTTLVRAGLYRLRDMDRHNRNWRPNLLVFSRHGTDAIDSLRGLARVLISGNGMATEFEIFGADSPQGTQNTDGEEDDDEGAPDEVGYFRREIESDDFHGVVAGVTAHHGFGGLEPNTVVMDFSAWREDPERFGKLLSHIGRRDMNLLLADSDTKGERRDPAKTIDVWWHAGGGNLPLCISLVRFVTRAARFRNADVRFLLLADEEVSGDYLRAETYRALDDNRVGATVRVIHSTSGEDDFDDHVRGESGDSDMVIIGLPDLVRGKGDTGGIDEALLERFDSLAKAVGDVIFFRAESSFVPVLTTERTGEPTGQVEVESPEAEELELPSLVTPGPRTLEDAAKLFANHHDDLARDLLDRGLVPLHERNIALITELGALADRHFDSLEKRLEKAKPGKQDNVVNRVQSAFLLDAEKLLAGFQEKDLVEQRSRLEARTDAFRRDGAFRPVTVQKVRRPKADFAAKADDPKHLAAFKRRKRALGVFQSTGNYRVNTEQLVRYYQAEAARGMLLASLERFATDSHALAVQVGKLLSTSTTSLALLGQRFDDDEDRDAFVKRAKRAIQERVQELQGDQETRQKRNRRVLLGSSRALSQRYADDLDRLDLARHQKRSRRLSLEAKEDLLRLDELPGAWLSAQEMLIYRAKLGLSVSTFQHRLATVVYRTRETVKVELTGGVRGSVQKLRDAYAKWLEEGGPTTGLKVATDLDHRFDPKPIVERVVRETTTLSAGLPEATTTLSDETIRELTLGQCQDIVTRRVSARGVAELLLETEFIGQVSRELEAVTPLEERAVTVARDVIRLVAFNLEEANNLDPASFEEQMRSVLASAVERLGAELEELDALAPRIDAFLIERLERVVDGTDPYELTRSSDNLTREFRKVGSKKAIRGLRGRVQEGVVRLRQLMVYLLYRRSAGVLYARRLSERATGRGPTADRLSALVGATRPRPEVMEALPFFYRQLFLGQSSVNKSFWVDRPEQMARGREAIGRHRAGAHGAVVVTGERHAGKTAFLHRLTQQALAGEKVTWVHAPRAGSASVAVLERAVREATHLEGDLDAMLSELPKGAVVVLDDLELWWERSERGLDAIERIYRAIVDHGDRILFLIGVGTTTFRLIDQLSPFADKAIGIIDCGPVGAEELKSIVELRHGTAGMRFELDEQDENTLSQWALARLFSKHFDYAGGTVGSALRAWVSSIREVNDKTLVIEAPEPQHWEVIDELTVEWKALLLTLALHKRRSPEALVRVTGLEGDVVDRDLGALARAGLIVQSRDGVVEIDPFMHHAITDRFVRGGLLS
ncbi:MAG: hypothetical protein DRJ42_12740 [Deltaproteobacteria bacterium]|nr:MAG: hypothetical protein DRJ42_12740 [Deltaproteobacteria bacterium]